MKYYIATVCLCLALAGCGGSNGNDKLYGEMDNSREFGTVLSVSQDSHFETNGLGNAAAGSGAAVAGNTAASVMSSSIFSPMGGVFSSAGNTVASNTSSNVTSGDVYVLHYEIRKDDGTIIKISQTPDVGESIIYSGQRVMIQRNGNFLKVYPAEVEHLRSTSG